MGELQFGRIVGYWPDLLAGVWVTLGLSAVSVGLGLGLGLVLALARYSRHPLLDWPAYAYIEFFRTTPPLVQIVWLYYGLPALVGRDLGAFGAAAVALGLNIAAFFGETFRAGIASIDRTQWQAARVLGLRLADTLRFVIVPQALRNVLPPLANQFIQLIKDSSLVSLVSIQELTFMAQDIQVLTHKVFEVLLFTGGVYFTICYGLSLAFGAIERRSAAMRR